MKLNEIPPYSGPHAIPGIRFRPAREALGVSAWGMNVIEFDPNCDGYPEHDHTGDGQEEVYFVLEGSVVLQEASGETQLGAGEAVRLAPETTRKFVTRDQPATMLVVGATPGTPYEVPAWAS
jgi:uncharacterized cupin superfamily protein